MDKNSVKAHKNAAKSNASALARTDGVCWWTSVVVVDLGAVLDDDDSITFSINFNKLSENPNNFRRRKWTDASDQKPFVEHQPSPPARLVSRSPFLLLPQGAADRRGVMYKGVYMYVWGKKSSSFFRFQKIEKKSPRP